MSCLMNPRREKGEPRLRGLVLFYINPAEARRACKLAAELAGRRHFLFNSNLWEIDSASGTFYICGPAVGAPMAVLVLEKLIALGAEKIIVCGTCGSLQSSLVIGDILLPVQALSEEGVSAHYPLAEQAFSSETLLILLESFLKDLSLPYRRGVVCSTDAPYRETLLDICRYQRDGIAGIDMEFSALLTVAAFRRVELAAVMVVSDQLYGNEWQPGFRHSLFKQRMQLLAKGLLDCIGGG